MLQVLTVLGLREGDLLGVGVGTEVLDDGVAEFGPDSRVAREIVEEPAEEGGCCVAPGEEDIEELAAQFDWVCSPSLVSDDDPGQGSGGHPAHH